MKNYLKKRFVLTDKGAEGAVVAITASTLKNLSYMLPSFILMASLQQMLEGTKLNMLLLVGAFVLVNVVMICLINWDYITTYNETYKESANLRLELSEKVKHLPLSFYSRHELTDLSQAIMADVSTIEHGMSHALPGYFAFMLTLFVMAPLLLIGNYRLGLAVLLPLLLSMGLCFLSQRLQKAATKSYYLDKRQSSKIFQEDIDLSMEIRAYGLADERQKAGIDYMEYLEKAHIRSEILQVLPISVSMAVAQFALAAPLYVGIKGYLAGEISPLYIAGYLFAAARLIDATAAFNAYFGELMYIDSPIEKIRQLKAADEQEGQPTNLSHFTVDLDHVGFAYLPDKPVIQDLSFRALEGKTTALVGPSGCGKSTVLSLVARLYDYDKGQIRVDDQDIQGIRTEDLFNAISMVFQNVLLFNGTVLDNIRLGRWEATDEEVLEAARLAQCDGFVHQLKDGYNTMIGENGSHLSGGERQRISLARAFLKNAPIILLDEIAASLDVENEKAIQESLNQLTKGKTVLIISHRMKSIQNVDQIVVMVDGTVEACGCHEDLLENSPTYQKLVASAEKSENFVY